jgi:hypothetical protein
MVNGSELLINVVTPNKPKVLIGLSQKASGQEQGLRNLLPQTRCHQRKGKT